jgi:hypothetical protein
MEAPYQARERGAALGPPGVLICSIDESLPGPSLEVKR